MNLFILRPLGCFIFYSRAYAIAKIIQKNQREYIDEQSNYGLSQDCVRIIKLYQQKRTLRFVIITPKSFIRYTKSKNKARLIFARDTLH